MIGYYWHFNIFIKCLPFRYCDYGCEHNRNYVYPHADLLFHLQSESIWVHVMTWWTLGHYHEKFPDCTWENSRLLIKDNYLIFLTEVIDIRFLTPQYLSSIFAAHLTYRTHWVKKWMVRIIRNSGYNWLFSLRNC